MNVLKWLQNKTRSRLSRDSVFSPSGQVDPRTQESVKRARKAFEDQQEQMSVRALKPHAADCPDPLTCTKSPCFKWEPDKIIGKPKVVKLKTKQERLNNKLDI